jgi:hypothetical protein
MTFQQVQAAAAAQGFSLIDNGVTFTMIFMLNGATVELQKKTMAETIRDISMIGNARLLNDFNISSQIGWRS